MAGFTVDRKKAHHLEGDTLLVSYKLQSFGRAIRYAPDLCRFLLEHRNVPARILQDVSVIVYV